MKEWRVYEVSWSDLEKSLNHFANQGWEILQAIPDMEMQPPMLSILMWREKDS